MSTQRPAFARLLLYLLFLVFCFFRELVSVVHFKDLYFCQQLCTCDFQVLGGIHFVYIGLVASARSLHVLVIFITILG